MPQTARAEAALRPTSMLVMALQANMALKLQKGSNTTKVAQPTRECKRKVRFDAKNI
jgi:hypothetical protein